MSALALRMPSQIAPAMRSKASSVTCALGLAAAHAVGISVCAAPISFMKPEIGMFWFWKRSKISSPIDTGGQPPPCTKRS